MGLNGKERWSRFIIILLLPVLVFGSTGFTVSRSYKVTRDTTQRRWGKFLAGEISSSCALMRKDDINRGVVLVADAKWNRILYCCVSNLAQLHSGKIRAFYMPLERECFGWPRGISADFDGNVFVADYWRHRIVKLHYNWNTQLLNYDGEFHGFSFPAGVAVMRNDNSISERSIWVADSGYNRIVKLTYEGVTQISYGSQGSGIGQFNGPARIVRGGNEGNSYYLYVLDRGNRRIVQLRHTPQSNSTSWIRSWSYPHYRDIIDIAYDGTLWVVDERNSQILRLLPDLSSVVFSFGSPGTGDNQFLNLRSLAIGLGRKRDGSIVFFDRAFFGEVWESGTGAQVYRLGVEIRNLHAYSYVCSAKIVFNLTDFAHLTIKVKNLRNNHEHQIFGGYVAPGSHQYLYYNNAGQYRAIVIARSRFESSRGNEPPVEVTQTYDFHISDGQQGGHDPPPRDPPPCPVLYPFTSSGYMEDNNLLAGSHLLQKDTTDFYKLQREPQPYDDFYYFMLGEDDDFISYIDHIQLMTVDCPDGLEVAVTPEGEVVTYKHRIAPISCRGEGGEDHLEKTILSGDGKIFSAQNGGQITCRFAHPSQGKPGGVGIVCRSKVRMWGATWEPFLGNGKNGWSRKNWSELFLRIDAHSRDTFDYQISWDDSIMIDQIFLAFDTVAEIDKRLYNPVYAFHSVGNDVLDRLVARDSKYVTLEKGERLILAFPYEASSQKRTFILVTTGYYKPKTRRYSTSDKATSPNQGKLLTVEPGTGNLHCVYDAGGNIVYARSTDKGETWETAEVDSGSHPSIVLDNSGMPRIAYLKNDTIFCKTLLTDNTWHKTIIFGGSERLKPSAPAIAQTYPRGLSDYSYCVFLLRNLSDNNSKICLSIFDVKKDIGPRPKEVASGESLMSPAIAITPKDLIHIVWEERGEIFYRASLGTGSSGEIIWSDVYNISESPDVVSENPVIEAYGENLIAAWKEGEPGEIYRRKRNVSYGVSKWEPIENISNSPDKKSDHPVLSTPDVVAWHERIDSVNHEVLAWIKGDIRNISETENSSKYPHITVEPPTASVSEGALVIEPEIVINTIWTEAVIPGTLSEVRFKRYAYTSSSAIIPIKYISVSVGKDAISPYCKRRDGIIDYGELSCDYSSSSLIYELPYFNPKSSYLLRAIVYKETPRRWRERVYVDSIFITEVVYFPYLPETVNIIIPREKYEDDLAIKKEVERIIGRYALIADLKVYEVSISESLQGDGQNLLIGKLGRPVLYQNRPNPFKGLTKFSFAIPKETYVSLIIYDVSGRKARTLISDKLKPGDYSLKWDGKDDRGRNLPQGVYFYRLEAEGFKEIKKTVLLR